MSTLLESYLANPLSHIANVIIGGCILYYIRLVIHRTFFIRNKFNPKGKVAISSTTTILRKALLHYGRISRSRPISCSRSRQTRRRCHHSRPYPLKAQRDLDGS